MLNKFLFFLFTISFVSFAYSEAPASHFALQCDKVLMIETDYSNDFKDVPLDLREFRDKGPFTFIYFDKEETKNGLSFVGQKGSYDKPFIWLQAIYFQDDPSEAFLYDSKFNHKESTNELHKFSVPNNKTYMVKEAYDVVSINRENLEVTMVTYDFERKDGVAIWTSYKDKFSSCKILSAAEEKAAGEKLSKDWTAIIKKKEEKERLENEAAKAKQKI